MDHLKFSTKGLQTEKFEIPFFVKSMMSPRSREKMLGTRNKQNQNLKNWIFERSRSARGIPTKQTSESVKTRSHNLGRARSPRLWLLSRPIKMAYVMLC